MPTQDSIRQQIASLEVEIAQLTARLPRHSIPPSMLLRLEELQDTVATLKADLDRLAPLAPNT